MSLQQRAARYWAQGHPGTNSKRDTCFPRCYPKFFEKQDKCYVWDTDGKRYLDFGAGLGTNLLGANHPKVNEAVIRQINTGMVSGSKPAPIEVELLEEIAVLLPIKNPAIRFLKTGSEVCSAAVRIARAHSGMPYVYSDGYHGWHDSFASLMPPAIGVKGDFKVAPIHTDTPWIGAIIEEPVKLDYSLERKAELKIRGMSARNRGAVLIYDEIITGLRVDDLTVSKYWGLDADIILLGKAIASGYPLAVVAGKAEVMNGHEYFISSTYSAEAVSMAASLATIKEVRQRKPKDLLFYGDRLRKSLNLLHPDIVFEGYGSRAMLNTTNKTTALFVQECAKAGLLFNKAWFFTFAHLEENVEEVVLNVCDDVLKKIRSGKAKYEGKYPEDTFERYTKDKAH